MSKTEATPEQETIEVNRFIVTKTRRGQNKLLKITFKNGRTATIDHDKACEALKVDDRQCWKDHKCYSSTTGVPKAVQTFEGAVIEYNDKKTEAPAEEAK